MIAESTTEEFVAACQKYTPDYFIHKFSAIPDEQWSDAVEVCSPGRWCVLCLCSCGEEIDYLHRLFGFGHWSVLAICDGKRPHLFPQATPKARMLAALEMLKADPAAYLK